ncbi:MAG: phosphatidylserine decarboxylase [Phycisphaeraceae bacterium]|nr:phosphatidylserine decarboxylase [Phycisphaeraceae bacterium]
MLSKHAKQECITIAAVGFMLSVALALTWFWWLVPLIIIVAFALLAFFRDPERRTPTQRGVMVAPSDGRISSIHEVEHYEPLGGPAVCVRIFMSVLDVHINYSPYHTAVESITHTPGEHLNTLKPESAEDNESNLLVLVHPNREYKMAAVRQVAGMLARTIVCHVHEDQVIQRGQRIGLIKLGSTTELYILKDLSPRLQVKDGQRVTGGVTVIAQITPKEGAAIIARPEDTPAKSDDDESEEDV